MRESWTIRSMAEATCCRIALVGKSMPAINTIVSSRERASRVVLAWSVVIEPSWPVFIACSMSSASPARHSPTTIRSGRMRRALMTRSRMATRLSPLRSGGRDSIRQPGVDHRAAEIDAPADGGDDEVDHAQQMVFVVELAVRQQDLAVALDVDVFMAVDHDFRQALVEHEVPDRSQCLVVAGELVLRNLGRVDHLSHNPPTMRFRDRSTVQAM